MIVKNSEFTISAVSPKQYPADGLKQIVLVGKSNVGKSSFINTMVNRKKLARTSSEPGKTRLINFYKVKGNYEKNSESTTQEQDFYLVDLPGYGFSKMSKQQQIEVGNFIEEYLVKCTNISLVVFLIDIRHNPTENDKMMYDYIIHQNLPCIIIANKADKIAVTKVDSQVKNLQDILNPLKDLTFIPYSSERRIYTDNAWSEIEKYL
jgi:ribosome biogenesis GTP-binding protein ysxC